MHALKRRGPLEALLPILGVLLLPSCRSSEGSVSLFYPPDYPKEAAKLLDVFAIDRENIPIAAAEINCESLLAKAVDGAAPAGGEAVDVPLSPPFEGKTIDKFPRGTPVLFVTAYNESSEIKKPILVGCSEEFDSSGGADVDINLQILIPVDTRLRKVAGDLQVASGQGQLPQPLCVLVDATTPAMRDQRYGLPGVRVRFQPDPSVTLEGGSSGQAVEVVTGPNGQGCVSASMPGELGAFEVEARAAELYATREEKEEDSVAVFLLSAIAPVDFSIEPVLTPAAPGKPIELGAGDVDGDGRTELVILTCDGSGPGCEVGTAGIAPFGAAHVSVISDALTPGGRREVFRGNLGRAPSGLAVGRFSSASRDDVAVLNGRSERCLNRAAGPCENSELRFLTWQGDALVDESSLALTASNAVGITSMDALGTGGVHNGFHSLATSGQGRRENQQPCKLNVCLPFDPFCAHPSCLSEKPCDCSSGACLCGSGEACFQEEGGKNLCRPVKRSCGTEGTACSTPRACDCVGASCSCAAQNEYCFRDGTTPQCLPFESACREPTECGCPAGELCECPPVGGCGADETVGLCLARDKELEVVRHSGGATAQRFLVKEACTQPVLTCIKAGTGRPTTTCTCLDNPAQGACSARDDCGCAVPTRITLTGRGSLTPYGIGAGILRDRAVNGYEFAVATAGGLDFVAKGSNDSYLWADRPVVNAPIHGVEAIDLDGDDADDLVWFARERCASGPNLQTQCPVVNQGATGANGQAPKGCFGVYLRYIDPLKRRSNVPISAARSCRRFLLEDIPSDMCTGDFNADGNADVALTSADSSQVLVYPGDGRGGILFPPQVVSIPVRGGVLSCADLDDDGLSDLAVGSKETGGVVLIRSQRAR